MAQQKIQSVQLSDSGVTPGPYTNADVTVDAAGRITAISNGSGGGGGTVTSVDILGGDGIGVTGGPITGSGVFNLTLGNLTPDSVAAVGTVTGSNLSGTNTGDQTITLIGDATGSGIASISVTIATFTGTSKGLVPVSAGGTTDFLRADGAWAPAGGGGGLEMNAYVISGSGDFGGNLFTFTSSATQLDEDNTTLWTYDSYTGGFTCQVEGVYEIVMECNINGVDGSNNSAWPNGLTAYGIDLEATYPALPPSIPTKIHTRDAPNDLFSGNFGLALFGSSQFNTSNNNSTFTERVIVKSDTTGVVIPRVFAGSYASGSPTTAFTMVISFMKISNYTPA